MEVQLVIAGADNQSLGSVAENVLAVSYAPQLELLQRASLTLTHGGLNTVLDSLACGVPMLVVPITYEQPAIAQRVRWVGAGEMIRPAGLHASQLRDRIGELLGDCSYANQARRIAEAIRAAGGVKRAGDLIEKSVGCNA